MFSDLQNLQTTLPPQKKYITGNNKIKNMLIFRNFIIISLALKFTWILFWGAIK